MLKKLIVLFLTALFLAACGSEKSPEIEIKEYIGQVEQNFEKRQAGKLKDQISDQYFDDYGYSQKDILRFAAGYILRHPAIHINTKISKLEISEDNNTAKLEIDVAVSAKPLNDKDIRMLQGEFHRFFLDLEKTQEWKLRSLKWQHVTIDEYLDGT